MIEQIGKGRYYNIYYVIRIPGFLGRLTSVIVTHRCIRNINE